MKQIKIGIWTTGLGFVALGLILLLSMNGSIPLSTLKYLWPILLVVFGMEAILTRTLRPDAQLRFSGFSIFVIVVVCLISFAGSAIPRLSMSPSYLVGVSGHLQVGADVRKVEIRLVDGNVTVQGTASNEATYTGELRVFASSEETAKNELNAQWKAAVNGDTLVLIQKRQTASPDFGWFLWNAKHPHLEVQVPNRLLSTVQTTNGEVVVTHMNADSQADTSNGAITFDGIHGSVIGSTSNGGVHARSIQGAVDLHTSNGNIQIQDVASKVAGRTTNGEVEVESAVLGDWTLITSNGSIRVQLPKQGNNVRITGDTSNGRVSGNVPWQYSGDDHDHGTATLGQGVHTMELRTSNGSIQVNQGD
ncbi:DUF4097 family beta strand repeat-containing protein [Alicyclobacillus macrosporangiidus]|uniref:DUF4097 family beta strand repeat-containing protein n=1 Tax=Alicyclobacillus macrosporangiidus TaxID=392015 RepID=UPI0018CC0FDC|nr:DUF4097 family beta strand repeat-containing protein [Alicyclobacillus macrosporangiidus]